jgi:hypothetical protein
MPSSFQNKHSPDFFIAQLPGLLQALFEPLGLGKSPIRGVSEPSQRVEPAIETTGSGRRGQKKSKEPEPKPPEPEKKK